ncbi:hypothetical protein C0585_00385 [Candidatus Woesearchaeota archaeon]|nr:MAG: hypothetical protein C0585_00385 [Candidatus Woesearchaeota archaeon]
MQKKIEQNPNQPELKLSAGPIKATVWKNHSKKEDGQDSEYSTITLERVYKDKEGNWQSTNIFRVSDLPKAQALLNRLYETIIVKDVVASV